jgi:hypothetical protein
MKNKNTLNYCNICGKLPICHYYYEKYNSPKIYEFYCRGCSKQVSASTKKETADLWNHKALEPVKNHAKRASK